MKQRRRIGYENKNGEEGEVSRGKGEGGESGGEGGGDGGEGRGGE